MLSNEYLSNVATLIKMTCHYETKMEEQRIKMSLTPHFQAKLIYNKLSIGNSGIPKEEIKQLFSKFMLNINEKELDYFYQLYSNDNQNLSWDDFYELICPINDNQIIVNANSNEYQNQQIITDLLLQFQRLIKIEIAYFRQAEPIRMVLFEKNKESGRQFCSLVEDHKKIISNQNLINFMKKQQFIFNNQDLYCFKKRIKCMDDYIPSQQFIKYCPLIPFQVLISRQPDYKLVTIRQIIQNFPDILKQNDAHQFEVFQNNVAPLSPQEPVQQQQQMITINSAPTFLQNDKSNMTNYEFFTGKKPVDSVQSTNLNYRFTSPQPIRPLDSNRQLLGFAQSQTQLSPYQTLIKEKSQQQLIDNQNQNQLTSNRNVDLLDQFLRPSANQTKPEFSNNQQFMKSLMNQYEAKPPQNVQTQYLPEIEEVSQNDILKEYLDQGQRLDATTNKVGQSDVRKYKIFDDAPSIQQNNYLLQNSLFNTITSQAKETIEEKPQNNIQQKPQSNFQQKPQSNFQQNPQNNLQQNPQNNLQQNPQNNFQQKPQIKSKQYVSPTQMYQTIN